MPQKVYQFTTPPRVLTPLVLPSTTTTSTSTSGNAGAGQVDSSNSQSTGATTTSPLTVKAVLCRVLRLVDVGSKRFLTNKVTQTNHPSHYLSSYIPAYIPTYLPLIYPISPLPPFSTSSCSLPPLPCCPFLSLHLSGGPQCDGSDRPAAVRGSPAHTPRRRRRRRHQVMGSAIYTSSYLYI